MWWATNPDRLKHEVQAIEALRDAQIWLVSATPRLEKELKFAFDFQIDVNGEPYCFTLVYPALFPDTPPIVVPREALRLSEHQYGAGGELCLEFRSDNWDPAITGAMMMESTYRLIAGERPSRDARAIVPSAHRASLGQQLRGQSFRFLVPSSFLELARSLPPGSRSAGKVVEVASARRTWSAYLATVTMEDGSVWKETGIPNSGRDGESATIVKLENLSVLPPLIDQSTVDLYAGASADFDGIGSRFTVFTDGEGARAVVSFTGQDGPVTFPYQMVDLHEEVSLRLPEAYDALLSKTVGLVGCGSLGSKIASSLARSGVGAFVLVDDDILKPGNLVRHDLDAGSVGAHKADALEARLKALRHGINVSVRRVQLGGQESSGTTASVLDELSKCDLLIDASADPQAFNFIASVARRARRPMVWAEVYAGGIGGCVMRLRPDVEPPPHAARQQYLAWCKDQDIPWIGENRDYGVRHEDAMPLVADDAEVTVIAAHASRMALDLLVRPTSSIFPHSSYVIGLAKAWIFSEPFDIRPFDFSPGEPWAMQAPQERTDEAIDYMLSIMKQVEDAH